MKVDEDLPQHVVERLQASAYDAVHVLDQSMGGWKDPELWSAIQREGLFLITGDKGSVMFVPIPRGLMRACSF